MRSGFGVLSPVTEKPYRLLAAGVYLVTMSACSSVSTTSTSRPSSSPSATASAPTTPSASARYAFLLPTGPTCLAADLVARPGIQGGALGNGIQYIVLTDHGTMSCSLRGTPQVQFLDSHGRVLATPTVRDEPTGYVPAIPNSGVGLLPVSDPGQPGAVGVRGQAALPLQYSDNECATSVAAVRLTLSSGSLTVTFQLPGSNFQGCSTPQVTVNPFQPAEGVV